MTLDHIDTATRLNFRWLSLTLTTMVANSANYFSSDSHSVKLCVIALLVLGQGASHSRPLCLTWQRRHARNLHRSAAHPRFKQFMHNDHCISFVLRSDTLRPRNSLHENSAGSPVHMAQRMAFFGLSRFLEAVCPAFDAPAVALAVPRAGSGAGAVAESAHRYKNSKNGANTVISRCGRSKFHARMVAVSNLRISSADTIESHWDTQMS